MVLGLIAFFVLVRATYPWSSRIRRSKLRRWLTKFMGEPGGQMIGHGYERFQAFVTCMFLFVLLNNLLGGDSGDGADGHPVVPLGIAVLTFLYTTFTDSASRACWVISSTLWGRCGGWRG